MALGVKSESSETVEELAINDRVNTAISAQFQPNQTDPRHVCDDDVITRH